MLLFGNVNLCFYLIRALLWLLKDTPLLSVLKFSTFLKSNQNIAVYYGVKRHCVKSRNTGLVYNGVSLTSWGEGASLALVVHFSSDAITIKIPYGVDVLLH